MKWIFLDGLYQEIGLMFANVVFPVHANLLKDLVGDCEGVMAYHIKKGQYGETSLDGLNVLILVSFKGNIWAGETKVDLALFFSIFKYRLSVFSQT